jgi:hypothetical protein
LHIAGKEEDATDIKLNNKLAIDINVSGKIVKYGARGGCL